MTSTERGVYVSDLLKVKRRLGDAACITSMVRQTLENPKDFEVRLQLDDGTFEHYRITILQADPLDRSEYHMHPHGYLHLWEDEHNSCPDHHRRPEQELS